MPPPVNNAASACNKSCPLVGDEINEFLSSEAVGVGIVFVQPTAILGVKVERSFGGDNGGKGFAGGAAGNSIVAAGAACDKGGAGG